MAGRMLIKKLAPLAVALALCLGARAADPVTIVYPDEDKPSFEITASEDWKMTQAEDDGDYFHLDGPTGAVFSFRTIEGTTESLDEAIKETIEDIGKMFKDVELGDAQDWTPNGLAGFYAVGTGKDKEDGTPMKIGVGWCALSDGKIAELWFVADATDEEGMGQAEKIANSLASPAAADDEKEDED